MTRPDIAKKAEASTTALLWVLYSFAWFL